MKSVLSRAVLLVVLAAASPDGFGQDLLSGRYSRERLGEILVPYAQWRPFPMPGDTEGWSRADQDMLQSYIGAAEHYLSYEFPHIPATKSLLIARTGDRDEYQSMSFKKREVLGTLLLAEIAENKGRFIDPIINGVWSICEESFWGVPAHLPQSKEYSGLMDVSAPFVDLFVAETATYLAWVDYFLGDKLDAVSPQIRRRIAFETKKRVFDPLMTRPHGWMTTNERGRRPNNWNPWICSNWLNAALLLEKDETRRADYVYRILDVLDEFLNPHPQDGGCDEGPGYWGAAAASLYDNLSLLNLATNDGFRYVFDDEKVKNMGRFIFRAQIGEEYFLNFSDADPRPGLAATMIYRYGKDIRDADMMQFAAHYRQPESGQLSRFHYFRNLFALFVRREFNDVVPRLPLPRDVWFPDLQVMVAREREGSAKGLFVAAKGGNNDESHNHNDIGNYVVYFDGLPVIIDIGRGTYTRKTFSARRYEIWYNRSDYHNVPTVNKTTQSPGGEFRAAAVQYRKNNAYAELALDIAGAYPADAGLNAVNRTIRFNRGRNVVVDDRFDLRSATSLTEHVMTCYPAEVLKPGVLAIHFRYPDGKKKDFVIRFDASAVDAVVERVPLGAPEDKGVITKWGDEIYRISFTSRSPAAKHRIRFEIAPL